MTEMINRRAILGLVAGAIMTPEGLWLPGQKTIFLPPKLRYTEDVWAMAAWMSSIGTLHHWTALAIATRRTRYVASHEQRMRAGPWINLSIRYPRYLLHPDLVSFDLALPPIDLADLPKGLSNFECVPARLYQYSDGRKRLEAA